MTAPSQAAANGLATVRGPTQSNRIEITVRASDDTAVWRRAVRDLAGRSVMANRFRAELVTAADGLARADTAWRVTLRTGGARATQVVRLSATDRDITMPLLLGVWLDAADSLEVSLDMAHRDGDGAVRIVIDVEPDRQAGTRFAVRPLPMEPRIEPGSGDMSWEMVAPADGRMVAAVGLPVERRALVTLFDLQIGQALWSSVVEAGPAPACGGSAGVVRLGVPLTGGRAYRLTMKLETAGAPVSCGAVTLMVLPAPG